MDYSFVRKLIKDASSEEILAIYTALQANGLEVYIQSEEAYQALTDASSCENGELYVSAADETYARQLISELGYEGLLCTQAENIVDAQMSEVEKAEEEYYRKHRQNQLLAGLLIAVVVVFMVIQFFNS